MENRIKRPTVIDWITPFIGMVAVGAGGLLAVVVRNVQTVLQWAALVTGMVVLSGTMLSLEWGLWVLTMIIYTRLSDVMVNVYSYPSIADPFIVFIIFMVAIRSLVNHKLPQGWERSALLTGLYGIVIFLSLLYANDFNEAQKGMTSFLKDAVIAILMSVLIQRKEGLRVAVWGLLGAGIFLGTISCYQGITHTMGDAYWGFGRTELANIVGSQSDNRVMGPFGSSNPYAQVMLVLIPLAFNRVVYEKKVILRIIAAWALVVTTGTVVLTYSRGGFLAMCVVLVLSFALIRPKPQYVLGGLIIIVAMIQFLPPKYLDRMSTLVKFLPGQGQDLQAEVSFRGRVSELTVGFMMFADHPILGIGLENFEKNYLDYSRSLGLDPRRTDRSAHNLYIEILAELGVVGLGVFIFLVGAIFRGILRGYRYLKEIYREDYATLVLSLGIAMIGYLTSAIFLSSNYPRNFWILIGICLAVPGMAQREWKVFFKKTDTTELAIYK